MVFFRTLVVLLAAILLCGFSPRVPRQMGWLVFWAGDMILYPADSVYPTYYNFFDHDHINGFSLNGYYDVFKCYDATRSITIMVNSDSTPSDLFVVPVEYYVRLGTLTAPGIDSEAYEVNDCLHKVQLEHLYFTDVDTMSIKPVSTKETRAYLKRYRPPFSFAWW
jgi:hypothetical protein